MLFYWNNFVSVIKGALCSFEVEIQTSIFNIYSINEVITQTQIYFCFHNWINKLFSEDKKFPEQFVPRKVAGSATCKQ